MANELRVVYQGSGSTYAIIRRKADWYAWNGSSFETWADGSVSTYDVALSSQGGDVYAADFPSGIAAGDYRAIYYESTSGVTTSDLILKTTDIFWNGEAASESEVSLSAYALTTVENVKRFMQISADTYDTLLADLINLVSAMIERETGRQYKARDYRERLNGRMQRRLVLRQHPVQHINRVSYGYLEAMSVSYSGDAIRANAQVYADPESSDGGGIRLVTVNSSGVRTANNLTFATYPSLSLMETAIELISGWTATVANNIPSADLYVTGAEDAKTRSVQFYYPDQDEDSYSLDQRNGILAFDQKSIGWYHGDDRFTCRHQGILIEYRGGYETIPADVDLLARELVKEAFYSGQNNTGLNSYSLGPYSVSFSEDPGAKARARLSLYVDSARLVASA
jgi:hypothetical protein